MYYVYRIIFKKTNKKYIGMTKNLEKRFYTHKLNLKNRTHHSFLFQEDFDIHDGDVEEDLEIIVLDSFESKEPATILEEELISKDYGNIYNVSRLSGGGDIISYHPKRDDIIEKHKNYKFTEERIERYREMFLGENNPNYGKNHKGNPNFEWSEERRKIISKKQRERMTSDDEDVVKIKESFIKASIGRVPSNACPISCNGEIYNSMREAGEALGCDFKKIARMCDSDKYPNIFRMQPKGNKFGAKKVSIEGVEYDSATEASISIGVSRVTITRWCNSEVKENCFFV